MRKTVFNQQGQRKKEKPKKKKKTKKKKKSMSYAYLLDMNYVRYARVSLQAVLRSNKKNWL